MKESHYKGKMAYFKQYMYKWLLIIDSKVLNLCIVKINAYQMIV